MISLDRWWNILVSPGNQPTLFLQRPCHQSSFYNKIKTTSKNKFEPPCATNPTKRPFSTIQEMVWNLYCLRPTFKTRQQTRKIISAFGDKYFLHSVRPTIASIMLSLWTNCITPELGRRNGESICFPPMQPGSIPAQCHVWVEFVFGSRPSLHKNHHLQIPIRPGDRACMKTR